MRLWDFIFKQNSIGGTLHVLAVFYASMHASGAHPVNKLPYNCCAAQALDTEPGVLCGAREIQHECGLDTMEIDFISCISY